MAMIMRSLVILISFLDLRILSQAVRINSLEMIASLLGQKIKESEVAMLFRVMPINFLGERTLSSGIRALSLVLKIG